jgi:hypothetical protein
MNGIAESQMVTTDLGRARPNRYNEIGLAYGVKSQYSPASENRKKWIHGWIS